MVAWSDLPKWYDTPRQGREHGKYVWKDVPHHHVGESHGDAVGVVVDGCPPLIEIDIADIQKELARRRPGQSRITTQRRESDEAQILSGVFEGKTLGTPISIGVWNADQRSKDYEHMRTKFRPSHADYTYQVKYGIRNWKGGGRASARETIGRVAAGAIAKKILAQEFGVEIVGYVKQVSNMIADVDPESVAMADVESTIVAVPDPDIAERMIERIDEARKAGDTLGGVVEAVARNVPPGLGEPVFDKLEAELGRGVLSLPACKGFEVGSGFGGITMTGSHAQRPVLQRGRSDKDPHELLRRHSGRHLKRREHRHSRRVQACGHHYDAPGNGRRGRQSHRAFGQGKARSVRSPRAVPMVEAMMALVLVDHALRQRGQVGDVG